MIETLEDRKTHLTRGHLLARNTLQNLIGICAPLLVGVLCVPLVVRGLGTDRFGVLTLAWAVIGYVTVFDLGLGRALTQLVANRLGAGEEHEIPSLAWTCMFLLLFVGFVGAIVGIVISPWLIHRVLKVPPALQPETLHAFYLLALAVPVITSMAALRGLLEAQQRFGLVNAVRIPMGILTFVVPLLVLRYSRSVFPVVAALMVARVIAWGVHLLLCLGVTPGLREHISWRRSAVGPLLRFGGWMTVTNIVGPFMVTFDRFVIGALLSVGAVAYYATPFEAVMKLLLIAGAVVGVMFPAFSTSFAQDYNRAAVLFDRTLKYLVIILFPVILPVIVFARDGLKLWLGPDFAQHSTHVLQWLALGVFINGLSQVPFAFVQGAGRPDLTAKLHLVELPVYLATLWWVVRAHGLDGVAMVWTGRIFVDALVLFRFAKRSLPVTTFLTRRTTLSIILASITLVLAMFPQGLFVKGSFLSVTLLGFASIVWFLMLTPEERALAQAYR
jgi:O-antigen/teichoic acid export membrane protein